MKNRLLTLTLSILSCHFGLFAEDFGITVSSADNIESIYNYNIDTLISHSEQERSVTSVEINGTDVNSKTKCKIVRPSRFLNLKRIKHTLFQGRYHNILSLFGGFASIFILILFTFIIVIPFTLIFIIIFSIYLGKKAKERTLSQKEKIGKGQKKESYQTEERGSVYSSEINKFHKKRGITTMCIAMGLTMILGLILGYIGTIVGAVIFFVGLGYYLNSKNNYK